MSQICNSEKVKERFGFSGRERVSRYQDPPSSIKIHMHNVTHWRPGMELALLPYRDGSRGVLRMLLTAFHPHH